MQVLSKALEVWGLRAVALTSPEASSIREEPMLADAFICNLRVSQRPGLLTWLARAEAEGAPFIVTQERPSCRLSAHVMGAAHTTGGS